MRIQKSVLLSLVSVMGLFACSTVHGIENDPNKEYQLTEKHGPWMVMVATFRDVQDMDRKKAGLTADEAASKLVHELRSKGIPAYSYAQDAKKGKIDTYDRLGNKDKRVYAAQRDMVCVLAGNYQKVDDQVAQKTLAYIKKMQPKFMNDKKSGAVVRNEKGPFSGAFLTINPELSPDQVVKKKADEATKWLNSGIDYPLVSLKHKFTLKVATFSGKSAIPLGSSRFNGREGEFGKSSDKDNPNLVKDNLSRAGEDATQLTYALRQASPVTRNLLGRDRFESYVYHDRYQSYVTIGGFDSEDDPDIKRLAEIFKAKYKSDDRGEYGLIAESLYLPNADRNSPPIQTWVFDPLPELIEVPRIK